MRISELAKLLNTSSKELIADIEKLTPDLRARGLIVPDSPKASNRLEDETSNEILYQYDLLRQEAQKARAEEEERHKREERERQLREEQERQRKLDEERRKQEEEQRRLADLELLKKQQEIDSHRTVPTPPVEPVAAPPSPASAPPGLAAAAEKAAESVAPPPSAPPRREKAKDKEKPKKLIVREIPVMKDEFEERGRRRGREKEREREREGEEGPPARRKRPPKGIAGPEEGAGRRFRPSRIFSMEDVPHRPLSPKARQKGGKGGDDASGRAGGAAIEEAPKVFRFTGDFTLGEFAEKTGISLADIMRHLLLMGEAITVNQLLNPDWAELLAQEFKVTIEIARESDEIDIEEMLEEDSPETLRPRPPIVTVMGHVDHGKTTLLDAIRKTKVAEGEFGGITQHIGAYTVATEKGRVTFLDTPGHEAFTSMRARGANMTDLVVLVVAADDGVMPQTIEAINHAKAAQVPLVVAVNKIDIPGANPLRVKQELMKYDLVPEDLGGTTICAEISAKKGIGIAELLDLILLQAEVLELKANPDRPAVGTVVESHIDPLRGATATLLVLRGTLRTGEIVLAGSDFGRVRAMYNDGGQPIEEAGPSTPVAILGLTRAPAAGETFVVCANEAQAREISEERVARRRRRGFTERAQVTLENLQDRLREGQVKDLNLILKADVQGSLEAISQAIARFPSTKVNPRVVHAGVGPVSVGDVDLASASDAVVIGFNVPTSPEARDLAESEKVQIRTYQVIYTLLDELQRAMLGLLETKYQEVIQARAEIRQVFKSGKFGHVAGCYVSSGTIEKGQKAHVMRGGEVVTQTVISSLRRVKDDVKQVPAGVECGIGLEDFSNVREGDTIETYTLEAMKQEL